MKTALIIHGSGDEPEFLSNDYPSASNSHWIPWLQKQLLVAGYLTQTPEMPRVFLPNYADWKQTFELFPIDEDSILVGHSCGGGFLLRWLSENPTKIKRLVLVAPWLDPEHRKDRAFFDFQIRPSLASDTDLHIVASDNDMTSIMTSVATIREKLPDAKYHLFPGYGHFCLSDMKTIKFPELRDIALHGSAK
jgi:predicted alpha/beta hydrolase family esterase